MTYTEGDWFAVPLRDAGYAIGFVARKHSNELGGMIVGYFFGPRCRTVPTLEQVSSLRSNEALLVCRCGDLSLVDGTWPLIGHTSEAAALKWPVPPFLSKDPISGELRKVFYRDEDIRQIAHHEPALREEVAHLHRDGLFGAGAVEIRLTSLLRGRDWSE
jgi:hypothetical protein